jgi:glycosyltransferase involved in cell wall biosynthesis
LLTAQQRHQRIKAPGIKYVSLWGNVGYYVAARRYMLGLINAGIPVTWTPMVWEWRNPHHVPYRGDAPGDPDLDAFCNKEIDYSTVILHVVPELFPMWIKQEKGKRIIGYVTWETDILPSHWAPLLNQVDVLLVPCRWNAEVFVRGGVTVPIHVIPHIVRGRAESVTDRASFLAKDPFVFYLIETWTARKAVWKTIRCYLETFTAEDGTLLVVKTSGATHCGTKLARFEKLTNLYSMVRAKLKIPPRLRLRRSPDRFATGMIGKYVNPASLRFITDELTEVQLTDLHRSGDCYVSLCRGEGWGLGAFDAAAFGKPVIITGYGGHLDYLPADLSYLVDYTMAPVRDDSFPKNRYRGHNWAEADVNHASRLMRHVYENRSESWERGEVLRRHISTRFNERKVTENLLEVLGNF